MQNYFKILGIPESFVVDEKALEQAYFAAQRATHPDRFVGKSEAERLEAVTRSTLVNHACETLKNPLARAEHLLNMQGIAVLDDTAKVPPEILMEMMALRERVMDASNDGVALGAMVGEVRALATANEALLREAFTGNDLTRAAHETLRLQYLGKAMEEAHMLIYRLKAAHG